MADQEEDYSTLPLPDRLVHKVWKVRLGAYEECTKAIQTSPDEGAPCFRPFNNDPDLLVKACKDANVVAQEAGVALLLAYLEYAGTSNALKTRATVVPALVDKCLGSTRAGTKQKAIDACLMYVELEAGEPVIEDLIPGLSAKLPKLVAATASAIRHIYAAFGAKTVKAKPAVQALPKLFSHADKNVRAEALELAITLYRWLGDAVRPMLLADLKPVQVKELETAFESITVGDVKQDRLLRSQKAAQEAAAAAGNDNADDATQADEPIDAFDLAEPVDVLAQVPSNFDEAMGSAKWKDRKEVLDVLVAASAVPRIREGDFGDVVRSLARCVQKDANVVCVGLAANCVENLAKGLKRSFGHYRNVLFTPMAERFKEKKQNVVDAIAAALDALFATTTFDDITEEVLSLVKNKNPSVRLQILLFTARALATTPTFPRKDDVKALAEGVVPLLGDTDAKVRDAAAEALGTLMKLVGERAMGAYLEGVDDIRKAKVQEFCGSATTKAKAPSPSASAPASAPTSRAPVKKTASSTSTGQLRKAPTLPAASALNPPSSPARKKVVSSGYGVSRQSTVAGKSLTSAGSRLTRPSDASGLSGSASSPKRTLMRPTAQTLHRGTPNGDGSSSSAAGALSAAERAELEQLRTQRQNWLATAADREELARLRAQVQELQMKHASLIDSHAKEAVQEDGRAKQLSILQRDLQAARLLGSKYEREIEALKAQLAGVRHVRSQAFDAVPVSISPPPHAPASPARTHASDEKENLRFSRLPQGKPTSIPSPQRPSSSSANHTPSHHAQSAPQPQPQPPTGGVSAAKADFANAANLTAKLRERIEQMKRNDEARRLAPSRD
ncbi:hypothetical protein PYCC9005_004137 [Savitreella phatthalungensis]